MGVSVSVLKKNVFTALAYILAGYVGSMLAVPPANVSPVWPASGIALAVVLLYGRDIAPGLAIGIIFTQFQSFADLSTPQATLATLLSTTLTSAGSMLQAAVGARLINRFVGENDPLVETRRIGRFLFLGGPAACLIAASIGTVTLYTVGTIGPGEIPLTWSSWWGGDTIGVMIFAPVVLILFAKPREVWRWRIKSVVYPLACVLAVFMLLFDFGYRQELQGLTAEFERQVNLLNPSIENRIQNEVALNRATKAFFDASEDITEADFKTFAGSLLEHSQGINALEWIPRVTDAGRAEFEQSWLGTHSITEPAADGTMTPAAQRPEYFPIRYLVPYRGNEQALGFDVSMNRDAGEALYDARDSGSTAATIPLVLVQDPDMLLGTVLYSPVYDGRVDWPTTAQRREHFRGVVATVFRVADRVAEISESVPNLQILLAISDAGQTIYQSPGFRTPHASGLRSLYSRTRIAVANRIWHVTFVPSGEFYEMHLFWNLWWLLLGSFAVTGLAGAGLMLLTGQTLRTERLVAERTHELEGVARERKRMIGIREMQNEALGAIAGPDSLESILLQLARMTESIFPDLRCSIHLLDDEARRIFTTIAPSLPEFFVKELEGLEIGPGVGSCGTAAYTRERVIVEDVRTHPYWGRFTGLAHRAGIGACWSEPIISDNELLGALALYADRPRKPLGTHLQLLHEIAGLTSIAIVRKRSESRIQKLAFYDTLTDLPNRRLLIDRLEREIASVSRHDAYGALLYIDLDNFKTLNDSMGHHIGDQLLSQVADRLRLCIRHEDTAARLGGDEFVILLRESSPDREKLSDKVLILAQRIQRELNNPYDLNGYQHHISPSIGITFFSKRVNSPEDVLKQADTAMYSAKARGRNAVSFYHPEMQKHVDERLRLERDLRSALADRQFRLVYQPQFDGESRIIGAEALLRWDHPEHGVVGPLSFIPVAEENRMITEIGAWVIEEACARLSAWSDLKYLAINISPVQLHGTNFVNHIHDTMHRFGIDGSRLMLEVTEGIMIGDVEATTSILGELRQMGVGISIDDFGKGYSSLVYLKTLPLNQLKIDKAFVSDISLDPSGNVIIETIIAMAQHFKLSVIAEGVETKQQLIFLQERGCTGFQGYYFSKPVSVEELESLFGERRHGMTG